MFVDREEIQRTALRQGDIIRGAVILGALNPSAILRTVGADGNLTSWGFASKLETGDVAVLSHCCEVSPENGVKLTSVILAPVRDIHSATQATKRDELIATNLISDGSRASFLKYFYLTPNADLTFKEGCVVDFSKCFSVRKNAYQSLVDAKCAQLADDARAFLSLKLALYFSRQETAAAPDVALKQPTRAAG